MQPCRTLYNLQHRPASKRQPVTLFGLLCGLVMCLTGPAFGESSDNFTSQLSYATSSTSSVAFEGAVPGHWQELEATHLDGIRGRYVPATELDLNAPWSVILWDEGRGGHAGSGNGSGSHQTQHGSNQQRHSLRTTTGR